MIGNRVVPQVPVQPAVALHGASALRRATKPKLSESQLLAATFEWTMNTLRCESLLGHSIKHMILSSSLI